MKRILSIVLSFSVLFSLLLSPSKVLADGMILPPGPYPIYEAGQKAAIFYQDGVEHIVLSVSLYGTAESDFGWVVPTPSEPTVEKGNAEIFDSLGDLTKPKQNLLEKIKDIDDYYYYGIAEGGRGGAEPAMEDTTVEVIEEKQVGILDIAILQAEKVQDLLDWMEENGYQFPSDTEGDIKPLPLEYESVRGESGTGSDEGLGVTYEETLDSPARVIPDIAPADAEIDVKRILQDYIDEGWYFITAKINPEFIEDEEPLDTYYYYQSDTDITPLRISFETVDLVYPLRISAGALSTQSILLYVFDDHKLRVSNYDLTYDVDGETASQFETTYAEKIDKSTIYDLTRSIGKPSWLDPQQDMYLTKLYTGYMYYTEMTKDVLFEDAADNKSVNAGEMSAWEWVQLPFVFIIYLPYRVVTGFFDFFSYGYWGGTWITTLFMLMAAAGSSLLFGALAILGLRKVKNKLGRILLHIVLFPSVWGVSLSASIVPTFLLAWIFTWFDISEEVVYIDALLMASMFSTALAVVIYKGVGKITKR